MAPGWSPRSLRASSALIAMLAVCGTCWFIALHNRFGSRPTGEPTDIAPELPSNIWDGLRARH